MSRESRVKHSTTEPLRSPKNLLLKQGYRYNKIRKAFSKFYHRHSELIVKYNIGLKTQGIPEAIFYDDLVNKFKQIVGKPHFSDQFKNIIKCYIKVGPCDSLHAWLYTQSWFIAMVSSLIARRWVMPQSL